ncbi:MAG: hypothetical protein ACYCZC_08680 [Acidithiobacillus sp.]
MAWRPSQWARLLRSSPTLVVMALALIASILLGGHSSAWALPAAEAIFFGAALILVARWSGKGPPDS